MLPNGGVLVSERDRGDIVEVLPDGSHRVAGTVPGVAAGGEGGLLGIEFLPGDGERPDRVYAYHTADSDNRVVRMPLTGTPGSLSLGGPEPVLTGIPRGGANHNGGRIAFGPDGLLYVTSGDAGNRDAAQDPGSLSGKILRVTPDGAAAPGNPFSNAVWSLGHRNPQGIAWDANGELWAAEFGQNTWDELNRISRGANYGWPIVEGVAGDPRFVDPVVAVVDLGGEPERARGDRRHALPRGAPRRAALDDRARDLRRRAHRDAVVRGRTRPHPRRRGGARRLALAHHQQHRRARLPS